MDNNSEKEREERLKRLTALGEAAASVAHEIRNPLGSMELYASLLAERLTEDAESLAMLEKIQAGLDSIERIVSGYLMFAVPARPHLGLVSLHAVLTDVEKFAAPPGGSVSFVLDIPETLTALGDAGMLKQVFLNLGLNAVQAMPDGGTITVSAHSEGEGVLVSFRDTGRGIPPEVREKIFDPFFTTKEKGSGLGLAIASSIIALHGGTISAGSAPGGGAEFTIRLKGI
ncbi:MAG: hypothetical protein HZA04_03475 [Nitrospinae bacterium]|nr:hypothetical protein [Nitrospinota bacterium]